MANCESGLGLGMIKINLNNRDEVIKELGDIISVDCDLHENVDFFREDTLKLGYDSELDRVVDEATKGKDLKDLKVFEEVFSEVFGALSEQEYFGQCEYVIEELGDGVIMLAYVYGG